MSAVCLCGRQRADGNVDAICHFRLEIPALVMPDVEEMHRIQLSEQQRTLTTFKRAKKVLIQTKKKKEEKR